MEQKGNRANSLPVTGTADTISDDALLALDLTFADPRVEFSLVWDVPKDAEMVKIVGSYQLQDEDFHCVRPGCGRSHKKGFVVLLSNEAHIIIGHICGRRLFGESWDEHKGDHDRLVRRQTLLRRRAALLSQEDELLRSLRELRAPLKRSDQLHREWSRSMEEIWSRLREAVVSHEGHLVEVTQVGEAFREALRDAERGAGRAGRSAVGNEQVETIHILMGQEFFRALARPKLDKAIDEIMAILATLSAPDPSNAVITRQTGLFDQALDNVDRAITIHNAALDALSEPNLLGIFNWTQRVDLGHQYRFKAGELIQRGSHGYPTQRISCSHGLDKVTLDLRELGRAETTGVEAA